MDDILDTEKIKEWKSIVTLVVFVIANIIVLRPFHIPIPFPRWLSNAIIRCMVSMRIIPPPDDTHGGDVRPEASPAHAPEIGGHANPSKFKAFIKAHVLWLQFPFNFVTAPLIADLFLLAIGAIGHVEVHDGTIGANNISPIDIMVFFLTLAYIAISIDASGLIRYLAFRVLKRGGQRGHLLFFYLYSFFFALGTFIGNDPIILSGTAFLAYMTRVSSNIVHPRAWIHSQFAVANIASAILVSSNPTNLVLAGAFSIKFIVYTANMIVPVVVTAIVLFPFLLYIVFNSEPLVPSSIEIHQLPEHLRGRDAVNPNIPHARGTAEEEEETMADSELKLLSLEEIMNPFLDKWGAMFGGIVMAATLVTLLAINAASQGTGEHPVFWVTLPAAVVMFTWDVAFGWIKRKDTRQIAARGRDEIERARVRRTLLEADDAEAIARGGDAARATGSGAVSSTDDARSTGIPPPEIILEEKGKGSGEVVALTERATTGSTNDMAVAPAGEGPTAGESGTATRRPSLESRVDREVARRRVERAARPVTLESWIEDKYHWAQQTFPTATAVLAHLPFALVPFALCMFVLVQALVTKGWVPVFAYGWDHWVDKTGTVGAIGGMGLLSVVLCNFAGTNIGTTILLSRVIQSWQEIHRRDMTSISSRTFWATVYSMALGVNYGAFSTAFSASLAGLLWRDILAKKHIRVRSLDFARVNLPIIAIAMSVGCLVLIGEVYLVRDDSPYDA